MKFSSTTLGEWYISRVARRRLSAAEPPLVPLRAAEAAPKGAPDTAEAPALDLALLPGGSSVVALVLDLPPLRRNGVDACPRPASAFAFLSLLVPAPGAQALVDPRQGVPWVLRHVLRQ